MVKGKQFENYRDTGDPIYASRVYNSQYVDELIFLDIDATNELRNPKFDLIKEVSKECFMPFTLGGGINTVRNIRDLLTVGADKVVINTSCVENPEVVMKGVDLFGSQCIVAGIDVRKRRNSYVVFTHSGKKETDLDLEKHIQHLNAYNVGEIFINSIDRDGMMNGYDLDLLKLVSSITKIPIIACGGAGNFMHLVDALANTNVSAVAMASIYHFGDNNPIRARSYLKNYGINIKEI